MKKLILLAIALNASISLAVDQPSDIIATSVTGTPSLVDTNNMGSIRVNNLDGSSKNTSFGVQVVAANQIELDDYLRKFELGYELIDDGKIVKLVRQKLTGDGSHSCGQVSIKGQGLVVSSGACEKLVAVVVPKGYGASVVGRWVGISTTLEMAAAKKAGSITNGQARAIGQVLKEASGDHERQTVVNDFIQKNVVSKNVKISPVQLQHILSLLNFDSKKVSVLPTFVNHVSDRQAAIPLIQSLVTGSDKERVEKILLGLPGN